MLIKLIAGKECAIEDVIKRLMWESGCDGCGTNAVGGLWSDFALWVQAVERQNQFE